MMANGVLGYLILAAFILRGVHSQGCKNNSLKLRDGDGLPYYYFQGASYSYFQGASYSSGINTKHINKNTTDGAIWCPDKSRANESFLEVDLTTQYSLCGVSTQGDTNGHTKSYKVKISSDRTTWKFYQNNGIDKVFQGNENSADIVYHDFNITDKVRFVRFYPITFEINACMGVELYGERILKGKCKDTLMQTNISAIKIASQPALQSGSNVTVVNGTGSWCWSSSTSDPFLKLDFGSDFLVICGFQFDFTGTVQLTYGEESVNREFQDIVGSTRQIFQERMLTNYVTLKPNGTSSCLSWKIFGYSKEVIVDEDIGLQYGNLDSLDYFHDENFESSNAQLDADKPPKDARLYKPGSSWCPRNPTKTSSLEIILVKKYHIFAISFQGYWNLRIKYNYKLSLKLEYSENYTTWKDVSSHDVDFDDIVEKHSFKEPVTARILRITIPGNRDRVKPCLRIELHGLTEEKTVSCKKPYPLGLNERLKIIPNGNISVSSEFDPSVPNNARLWSSGCWCAKRKPQQSISIDLGQLVSISGVATQGCDYGNTEKYKIKYSYDGNIWYEYDVGTTALIFRANSPLSDKDIIFANWLTKIITTRHIQVEIQKYSGDPCLRLEVYGCRKDAAMPIIERWSESKLLNRTKYSKIVLNCEVHGQAGMNVVWKKDGVTLHNSSFESINKEFPRKVSISGVAKTRVNIKYNNDQDIYNNFNCTANNSRRLFCRSVYSCSASYPGAIIPSQRNVDVTVVPSIVLPDIPKKLSFSNVKSNSAALNWQAADDYLESRLEAYVIHVSNGTNRTKIRVTSGIEEKNQTYHLQNLTEYTFYSIKISAVSAITTSDFTKTVNILTLFGPQIVTTKSGVKIVKENEKNVTISCTGKSYPTPYVTWKKDGKEITRLNSTQATNGSTVYQIITPSGWNNKSDEHLVVTSELFLRPNGIKYEDYGKYICEVVNANESSTPLTKSVEIQFPPRIIQGPKNTTINEGDNVTLTCDAEGPPKPTFTWRNVSEKITIEKIVSNQSKLKLKNVRSAGLYHFTVTCVASNKGGNSTANAIIEILVKPRIIKLSPNQTATLYDNVTLTCEILANPSAQIWWTKNGNKSHFSNVQFENDNKTLVITRAVLENMGMYSCHAKNSLSYKNQSLTLKLKAFPKAYIVGEEIRKLRQGEKNTSITCLGYGYPNPKATWKLKKTKIPENSESPIGSGVYQRRSTNDIDLENVTSTLYFNQRGSTFEDYGNYTCEVSIEPEHGIDKKIVKIIFYPIVTAGPRSYTALQDSNVRFDCEVDGQPLPSTSWLFENKTVTTNHSVLSNGSLLIYSVQSTDTYEGVYSCFAENKAGQSEKSNSHLTVHVPARITHISKTEVHQLKDNVTLTCNVQGDPHPSVYWTLTKTNESRPLEPPKFVFSNYNQSLVIKNVTLDEQGMYICNAKNKYANDTKNVTVNVEVRPEAMVNKTAIYLRSINEIAIIRCSGRGYPPPVVSWFTYGEMVDTNSTLSSDVYQIVGETEPASFLGWISTVLYVKPDNSHLQFRNYTCNATKLKDNEKDIKMVEVVLVPTVSITKDPDASTVLEGTNVTFTCSAGGAPKPTISWRKVDGNTSTMISTIKPSDGKNVLMLTNVTNDDEGVYECTAHNRGSPVTKQIRLIVHVKPRILQRIKTDDVQNSTSYKFNCSAYGDPALTYSWTINGNQTIPNSVLRNENKTLHILPVTIDNEGIYKCLVKNIEGKASTSATITVFARPKILDCPMELTRNESDSARFFCAGNGIPTPDINWRKNGQEITNSTKYDIISNSNGKMNVRKSFLSIKNLEYADKGNYSCTLKNRKDEDVKTAVLVVQVRPVPTIGPNRMAVNIRKPVILNCKVFGFPRPEVIWIKNDENLVNKTHYNISNYGDGSNLTWYSDLSIKSVERDDTASYTCFSKNPAGTDNDKVQLIVLERPDPLSVSISNVSARSVILKWKTNFNGNKDILNYTLSYFIAGNKPNTTSIKLPPSFGSYIVTSLKPYRNYTFEMTATNEIGGSDVSTISMETLEDRPTRPRAVAVDVLSSSSLNVTWLPPQEENGIILKYVIYYQRVGSNETSSLNATAFERSKIIMNLKPYTNYSIEMVAYTSVGPGKKSERKRALTREAAPSSPRNLTVKVESNTTILVSWSPPKYENGIIRQYSIHVQEAMNSSERIVNNSAKTNYLVRCLKPFTYYTFRIRARTVAGWGNFTEAKTVRTAEGLPSEPLNLIANASSNTTVDLSWSDPTFHNGNITGYHVYYKKIGNSSTVTEKLTNITQFLVGDLTPYTNYSLWVRARTSAGIGNKSLTRFAMTFEGIPSEPEDVKGRALNSKAIHVSWTEPKNPYGVIIKYVVHYRKTKDRENRRMTSKALKDRKLDLSSLSLYTNYSIAVQAFTRAGGGIWSESIRVRTAPGIPVTPTPFTGALPTFIPSGIAFDPTRMIAVDLSKLKFSDDNGKILLYKVIVVMVDDEMVKDLSEIFNKKEPKLLSYATWKKMDVKDRIGKPYIASVFNGDSFEENKKFVIGKGETYKDVRRWKRADVEYENGELIPGKEYAVALRGYTAEGKYATSQFLKHIKTDRRPPTAPRDSVGTVYVVVIVVVAVILSSLFLTAVWFKLRKNRRDEETPDGGASIGIRNLGHPVPLAEFRSYVSSKQFGEEFQDIPKVVDREKSSATSVNNMPKNRYKNIIPYDYTRVRLHRDEGDDDTDYINASIIKGLKVPAKYIATQGPLPHTTNDFWKMVWEQDVTSIVMLTGLEENGTVKCYQYWPANTDEKEYGNLSLKLTGETVLADFTIRYFEIKETTAGQVRLVQHLHFTAWPDHGVPRYPGPLLHFHSRYRSGLSGPEPVVVHCSAGCGRTGTFIALDYILHKLDVEQNDDPSIDVLHFVREMRGQRILMVQTEAQYRFIHVAILEAVTFRDTEISSTDIRVRAAILRETIPGTNKTKGKEIFENLQKRIFHESCENGTSSDNQKKNRSQLVPFDYNRVQLTEMPNTTDYINASFICGYQYTKNFIATQHPLPNTVNDFWRMVHEQKSSAVVAISTREETYEFGSYWPEEGYTSYGPITVSFEGINKDFAALGYVVRKFNLTDTRDSHGRSFGVTHFQFVDWARTSLPLATSMLKLLSEVEKAQRAAGNKLVTVHCSDGGGRTGTLCAIVSCIERVKVENNIDLPMTLRNLQAQRSDMMENEAQYVFCYDVVSAFLTSFDDQMYDNFKRSTGDVDDDDNYPETSKDGQNRLVSKF